MPFSVSAGSEPVAGYRIIRKLGQGGFGEVWEAEAPGGIRVAMKFIRLDSDQAQPELRALEIIRNIRHPHLLDVQFSVQVEDVVLIAMPLCDQSLWDRLKQCTKEGRLGLPRDELLGYMEELAKAVDYLNEPRHRNGDGHCIGIQHRDIKPHNIFLVGGCVRLADFGLAKFLQDSLASHTGSMSPNYAAPEALKGTVAPQSDQYSLGVTYYQLRTGQLPIAGKTIGEIILNHLNGTPNLSALPEEERPIVGRALAKEPGARWPNCQTFVTHLSKAIRIGTGEEPGCAPPGCIASLPTEPRPDPVETLPLTDRSGPGPLSATEHDTGSAATLPATKDSASPGWRPSGGPLEENRRRPWPLIAGAVGLLLVVAVLVVVLLMKGTTRGGSGPVEGDPLADAVIKAAPASDKGATSSAVESAEPAAPTTAPTERRIVRFEPPTATVLIDGKARALDATGRVALELPAETPVTVIARAKGYQEFKKTILDRDWRASEDTIRLEPEPIPVEQLASRAQEVLRDRCSSCHGIDFRARGLDVLDRDALVTKSRPDRPPYVVPGHADHSALWTVIVVQGHPGLDRKDVPSAMEKAILRRWIDAGAPWPEGERRPFRGERHVLTAIRDHLRMAPEEDRKYQRFFAFANLHNNPKVDSEELQLYRAALAKLLNSLSWVPSLVVPTSIDEDQIVFCIDLRRLGWDKYGHWNEILKPYPYGLTHGGEQDPLHAIEEEVHSLSNEDLPYVRADWFVATASRPPLYRTLLRLPETSRDLEEMLQVDVKSDFFQDKLLRAGLSKGRVTGRNQVFERHGGPTEGFYWRTYDFRSNQAKGDIFRFPLGPDYDGSPFWPLAFAPSFGAILFSLPNGLQAYMLVDREGKRIDSTPAEIARDPFQIFGTPTIVTGLSCMACHRRGIIPLRDEVRRGAAVTGQAMEKVKALYPEPAEMERLRVGDEQRFLKAAEEVTGPFLNNGPGFARTIRDVPEPVGALARRFGKDLGLEDVAHELGLQDSRVVQGRLKATPRLRRLGLEPLIAGNSIKREVWDDAFDQAAIELDVGTPHRSF